MKFIGIDGKQYVINFDTHSRHVEYPSKLHVHAREIIEKIFPYCALYEEVTLKGCVLNKSALVADFFLPQLPLIVEVQGEQHYKYVKYFHKSKGKFEESLQRDSIKKEWCNLNNITYIELPHDKIKQWEKIINDQLT